MGCVDHLEPRRRLVKRTWTSVLKAAPLPQGAKGDRRQIRDLPHHCDRRFGAIASVSKSNTGGRLNRRPPIGTYLTSPLQHMSACGRETHVEAANFTLDGEQAADLRTAGVARRQAVAGGFLDLIPELCVQTRGSTGVSHGVEVSTSDFWQRRRGRAEVGRS